MRDQGTAKPQKDIGAVVLLVYAGISMLVTIVFTAVPMVRQSFAEGRSLSAEKGLTGGYAVLWEESFTKLRERLRPYETVGFVSDLPAEMTRAEFYLAQFHLAPVRLTPLPDGVRLVVGHFKRSRTPHPSHGYAHLTPIEDYGGGIVLLRVDDE